MRSLGLTDIMNKLNMIPDDNQKLNTSLATISTQLENLETLIEGQPNGNNQRNRPKKDCDVRRNNFEDELHDDIINKVKVDISPFDGIYNPNNCVIGLLIWTIFFIGTEC